MSIDKYIAMETTFVDYKEAMENKKAKNWLKSVSAFANTGTGRIVFGVRDTDHGKIGLQNCQEDGEKITELINSRIQPSPNYDIQYERDGDKDFIVLTIRKGISTPYYYAHEGTKIAYVRKGSQSVIAPDHELNALILYGRGLTYDALPSPFQLNEISFTLLEANYNNTIVIGDKFDKERDLISFGLVKTDGTVTNAGALLCDQGILWHSRVFCTRWKGKTKGRVDLDAIDDKEYSGSLITLLENAVTFVRNNSQNMWTIKGLTREEEVDYPYQAVREVIVNALIHRDYQILGSEIHIDMYDDRMEVYSPGGMANGWRIQDLNLFHIPSIRRNPIISDIFSRMHFMDRKGSGITRIMGAYDEIDEKPQFFRRPLRSLWFCRI
jgi:ATP-dependent DNA helicase RecG